MDRVEGFAAALAEELAARHRGVVVAVLDGVRTRIAAAGQATHDSVFEIGAVTRTFTALTLARLVAAGTAGWDEPLADLLGTPVPHRNGVEITLGQLAMHTSGLPRLPRGVQWGSLLRGQRADPFAACTPEFLVEGLRRTRLRFTPGTGHATSHLGGGLLGLALTRRTGLDFAALVAREVCAPLGLRDTGLFIEPLLQGHDERGYAASAWHPAGMAAAVGLRSTAADLAVLLRAHLEPGDGPLAPAMDLIRSHRLPLGEGFTVHAGWFRRDEPGPSRYSHAGMTGGFSSLISYVPERRTAIAVLSSSRLSVEDEALGLLFALA